MSYQDQLSIDELRVNLHNRLQTLMASCKEHGRSRLQICSDDGRECVIATGNTLAKKEILKKAGFQWDGQQRVWWKYADVA